MSESCLNCHSAEVHTVLNQVFDTRFGIPDEFQIVQCNHCSFEQLSPIPTSEQLIHWYQEYYNFQGDKRTLYVRLRDLFYHSFLYKIWLLIDGDIAFHTLKGNGRLLDVGCNEGRGMELFQRNGFSVEGVDVNENAAKIAKAKGLNVHITTLDKFFPDKKFDAVILSNVLEHDLEPKRLLENVYRILNEKGKVYISCPNAKSLLRTLFGRYWINWHVPFHVSFFSKKTLIKLLEASGFNVKKFMVKTPAIWVTQSLIARLFAKPGKSVKQFRNPLIVMPLLFVIRFFFFPIWFFLNIFDRGDCLIVEAQKQIK